MCVGYFLVLLDVTIVNVALPSIDRDLDAGVSGLQWVVDGYALPLAALLLAGGTTATGPATSRSRCSAWPFSASGHWPAGSRPALGCWSRRVPSRASARPCSCRRRSRSSGARSRSSRAGARDRRLGGGRQRRPAGRAAGRWRAGRVAGLAGGVPGQRADRRGGRSGGPSDGHRKPRPFDPAAGRPRGLSRAGFLAALTAAVIGSERDGVTRSPSPWRCCRWHCWCAS